jgi:transcriptional regulator
MGHHPLPVLKGTLDLIILKTLSLGSLHGYDIFKWVRQKIGEDIQIEHAALYQSLLRLEKKGWLEAEWRKSPTGREVRFYSLTDEGKSELAARTSSWDRYSKAIYHILDIVEA